MNKWAPPELCIQESDSNQQMKTVRTELIDHDQGPKLTTDRDVGQILIELQRL